MQKTLHRTSARFGAMAACITTGLGLLAMQGHALLGWLVGQLGLSYATAFVIVSLIADGSLWYVALVYPYVVPLIATLQWMILIFSTSVIVGW